MIVTLVLGLFLAASTTALVGCSKGETKKTEATPTKDTKATKTTVADPPPLVSLGGLGVLGG